MQIASTIHVSKKLVLSGYKLLVNQILANK